MTERTIPERTDDQVRTLARRIRRADALNNAHAVVVDNPSPNPRVQEEMEVELRAVAEEARVEVGRLKREYGFPGY